MGARARPGFASVRRACARAPHERLTLGRTRCVACAVVAWARRLLSDAGSAATACAAAGGLGARTAQNGKRTAPKGGPLVLKKPAATYSPGPLRAKYHRR